MAIEQLDNTPRCQHLRLSGRQCKAPARRGTNYCLFHEAEHVTSPNLTFPPVEDAATVQVAADQVLQALRDDTIEFPRASLMLSGLRLMRANLKRLQEELGDEIAPAPAAKQEEEEVPSLLEYLLPTFEQIDAEQAAIDGRPTLPTITKEELAEARRQGNEVELLLEHYQFRDAKTGALIRRDKAKAQDDGGKVA